MTQQIPEAVAKALKAFEDGARYSTEGRSGTFDPDLVCDVLELIAEKAMAEGGNALFWMATLIQAGRLNEALLVLAQEVAKNGSSKKIQAVILLVKELLEEGSAEASGPRKFRPNRPNRESRPQGGNGGNSSGRDERQMPPRASEHVPASPPRWNSTMNGGQPQQGPTPPHVGHHQPPSAPPLPQTPPQGGSRPGVPDYEQQYGQPNYGQPQQGSTQEAPPLLPRRPEPAPVWEQEPESTPLPEDNSGEHRPPEKDLAADLNAKPKDDVIYRD